MIKENNVRRKKTKSVGEVLLCEIYVPGFLDPGHFITLAFNSTSFLKLTKMISE
jgi:hypothetical protein